MSNQRQKVWLPLLILFSINTMNFYDRGIIAAVTEPIRKEWQLSDTAMGALGTAFIILYAIIGVPLGRLSDKAARVRILSICTAIWSVMTAASGIAWNYGSLAAARLGVGIGEAGCSPAANSLLGDLFPARRRARAISIFMLGLPVGTLLNFMLSGRIAQSYGWRAAFYVACLPGLVIAVLALLIREPERGAAETYKTPTAMPVESPYRRVLGIPTLWWIIISGALHNFNMYALNSFVPAFLMRHHGTNLARAGLVTSLVLGASGIPGLLIGGWLADHLGKDRKNGRLMLGALAMLLAAPFMYLSLGVGKGAVTNFALLMGAGMVLMFFYYATVYAVVQDVVEPQLRGTAMALYFFAMYLLGGALGPVGTGKLSDSLAGMAAASSGVGVVNEYYKAVGLHSAMYIIPMLMLLLCVVLFAASRTVAEDMRRLHKRMTNPVVAD